MLTENAVFLNAIAVVAFVVEKTRVSSVSLENVFGTRRPLFPKESFRNKISRRNNENSDTLTQQRIYIISIVLYSTKKDCKILFNGCAIKIKKKTQIELRFSKYKNISVGN